MLLAGSVKKTREVISPPRPAKPETKRKIEYTLCDVCSSEVQSPRVCPLCGRDICGKITCIVHTYPDGGDYCERICKFCYHAQNLHASELAAIERWYDNKLVIHKAMVKRESLKEGNK